MSKSSKPVALRVKSDKNSAKKRAQARQQMITMVIVGIAALVVVVIAIAVLVPRSSTTVSADQYASLPTGVTRTGPNASITYPYDVPYLGSPSAPFKIEEIGSFSCPVCMVYHDSTFVHLIDEVQAGKLQYLFLPTTETGDYPAAPGTMAGYCAALQNKFWPMHDRLYAEQAAYGQTAAAASHIQGDATAIGLNMGQFNTCLTSPAATQFVTDANNYANARGLVGTPSIFLYVNGRQLTPPSSDPQETANSMAYVTAADLHGMIDAAKAGG